MNNANVNSCSSCRGRRLMMVYGPRCVCTIMLDNDRHMGAIPNDLNIAQDEYLRFIVCADCGHMHGSWPLPHNVLREDEDIDFHGAIREAFNEANEESGNSTPFNEVNQANNSTFVNEVNEVNQESNGSTPVDIRNPVIGYGRITGFLIPTIGSITPIFGPLTPTGRQVGLSSEIMGFSVEDVDPVNHSGTFTPVGSAIYSITDNNRLVDLPRRSTNQISLIGSTYSRRQKLEDNYQDEHENNSLETIHAEQFEETAQLGRDFVNTIRHNNIDIINITEETPLGSLNMLNEGPLNEQILTPTISTVPYPYRTEWQIYGDDINNTDTITPLPVIHSHNTRYTRNEWLTKRANENNTNTISISTSDTSHRISDSVLPLPVIHSLNTSINQGQQTVPIPGVVISNINTQTKDK